MPADLGYINARVKGMRSRLLSPGQLEEMLNVPDIEGMMQVLMNTPYARDLEEALSRYTGIRAIDEALSRNFFQTTRTILGFADGRPKRWIQTILLRWDLANIRSILRGKHSGRPPEEILGTLLPAGELSEVTLKDLAEQPDVRAMAGVLGLWEHPLAAPLLEGAEEYARTGDLLSLELRLDRAYAAHVLRVASGKGHNEQVLRMVLQLEIDLTNVKTALKAQRVNEPPEEKRRYFIPGGQVVTEDLFLDLADPHREAQGRRALRLRGFPEFPPSSDLLEVEKALDRFFSREISSLYLGDPLGIDVVIGYLAMKYNEIVNLRLIARSKLLGLSRERVRREMVLV
ncbi:MAG: V-type ATPase subunit [Armatimonadota bacterium]|nr:V-type ATPase subunit [Armatimonadota bacterium]MDR5703978.1 V-type ATPase subunit [Armatimonadota bacterium]MDR7434417.1 V-type ATPase subunit [Armatimonadota bacterium]